VLETIGYIDYDVAVRCPYCDVELQLNQPPYVNGEDPEYELSEDELGGALFGSTAKPARWSGFKIEYKCFACNRSFVLSSFEV